MSTLIQDLPDERNIYDYDVDEEYEDSDVEYEEETVIDNKKNVKNKAKITDEQETKTLSTSSNKNIIWSIANEINLENVILFFIISIGLLPYFNNFLNNASIFKNNGFYKILTQSVISVALYRIILNTFL